MKNYTNFLSLTSRWSTLTLHRLTSVLEPKIWSLSCWSTTLCTDCPSRESCPTPGWLSAPPRNPQPWTTQSPANEPFGSTPPNIWGLYMRGWWSAEHRLWNMWNMSTVQLIHQNLLVLLHWLQNRFTWMCLSAGILSHLVTFPNLLSSRVSWSRQWHSIACKYFFCV